jgi:hypothetical protein
MMQPAVHWITFTAAHTKSFHVEESIQLSVRGQSVTVSGDRVKPAYVLNETGQGTATTEPPPRRTRHRHQPRRPHAPVAASACRKATALERPSPRVCDVGAYPLHRAASGMTGLLAGWEVPAPIVPPADKAAAFPQRSITVRLPITEAFSRSDPPQVVEAFSQNDPNTSGYNSQENHPTKILGRKISCLME